MTAPAPPASSPGAAFARRAVAIALKDLALEVRSRDIIAGAVVFCLLTVLVMSFAIDPSVARQSGAVGGLLWVTLLFSSALSLGKGAALERENACMDVLLVVPGDRAAIFLGKAAANALFVATIALLMLPVFGVLFHMELWGALLPLLAPIALGAVAIAAPGTLVATMVLETRAREMLLPILLLPLQVPVLIACVQSTTSILAGAPLSDSRLWLEVLLAFDLVFATVAAALYDRLMES